MCVHSKHFYRRNYWLNLAKKEYVDHVPDKLFILKKSLFRAGLE